MVKFLEDQVGFLCFSDENIVPRREGATLFIVLGLKDNSWGATNDVQEFALDDVQASVTVVRYLGEKNKKERK